MLKRTVVTRVLRVCAVEHKLLCVEGRSYGKCGDSTEDPCSRLRKKSLNLTNMNPNIIKLQYAVRGPLVLRSLAIAAELRKGVKKPFKTVIGANIGDAQAMGQKPVTFLRQVLACVEYPWLIECSNLPSDVKDRARNILSVCGMINDVFSGKSMGSYTVSYGMELIRRAVAGYIERRDGHPARWEDIVLTTGASTGIKSCLQLFVKDIDGKPPGVLIPIPQYPLYSATLAEFGLVAAEYYLNEEKTWALDVNELEHALQKTPSKVRALVAINPGNPTGQVQTKESIEAVIKFAHKHGLFLFADEVYQDNVYAQGSQFFSFKKVMRDMGKPYSEELELVSFMSASKGYMGECGLRGGWMEIVNMEPKVQEHLFKALSAMLCPNTVGQATLHVIADPPKNGEPSYNLFMEEKTAILNSLKERAGMIVQTFNSMKGFKCNTVQGAMYAFPKIEIPPKAIEAAKKDNKAPDVFYAFRLLEETGICIIPGTGFGQKPGTYHFRTTILPQKPLLTEMLKIFGQFHDKFTKEFS